jgi:hypothetical protein
MKFAKFLNYLVAAACVYTIGYCRSAWDMAQKYGEYLPDGAVRLEPFMGLNFAAYKQEKEKDD